MNVYAPKAARQWEGLFARLERVMAGFNGVVMFGGDFNCIVRPAVDRTHIETATSHHSPALVRLLATVSLVDVQACEAAEVIESRVLNYFAAPPHTHTGTHSQMETRPQTASIAGM